MTHRSHQSSARNKAATRGHISPRRPSTAPPGPRSVRAIAAAPPIPEPAPESRETGPRGLPEREYEKTEEIHANIAALLSLLKIVRADDIMRELGLSRSNANFHMSKMAAKGMLCLAFEPHRGQNRYIAVRDFRVLSELIEPAPPQRGESRPAKS